MTALDTIVARLEDCFVGIERARMRDIPVLNPVLSVRAVGMREWHQSWLCVLVTPWFMNVVLLPKADNEEEGVQVGSKHMVVFPAGRFEFIEGYEDTIGRHWMCSMFSPVLEFENQQAAVATAEAVLEELFKATEDQVPDDADMTAIWRGEFVDPKAAEPGADTFDDNSVSTPSRRALLTGLPNREPRQ